MTTPRSILLPNYLLQEPWRDLADAIDFVFKTRIDDPVQWLARLREKYLLNETVFRAIEEGRMVSESDLDSFDRETRIQSIGMIGLRIPESDKFSTAHYERLQRDLSTYWYNKGTGSLADFISVVLNVPVSLSVLWTDDYVNFRVEGSPDIGIPVYEGGTWYPTTHVQFAYDPTAAPGVPLSTLLSLFYALANYNLVVGQVALDMFLTVAHSNDPATRFPNTPGTPAYALGLYYEVDVALIGTSGVVPAPAVLNDVVASTVPVVVGSNQVIIPN